MTSRIYGRNTIAILLLLLLLLLSAFIKRTFADATNALGHHRRTVRS